jgi:uncharacterized protein
VILDLTSFLDSKELTCDYRFVVDKTKVEVDKSIVLTDDVTCDVLVSKVDGNLFANVAMTYKYEENCARCNKPFVHMVNTAFEVAIDIEDDDALTVNMKQDTINLNDAISEMIYLTKPIKVLCHEECKGICTKCGSNKNHEICNCDENKVDPRFQELIKLLDKEV